MGTEKTEEHYNKGYKRGGWMGRYFLEAKLIEEYYPSWKVAYDYVIENKIKSVIDFGCGPGHFSSLFSESDGVDYVGFDFSKVAIQQAIERNENNRNCTFFHKNLENYNPTEDDKNNCTFFTAFEFLEHISFDLNLLAKIKKESQIIFSVPNYDSGGHVRHFANTAQVEERYGQLFDLKNLSTTHIGAKKKIFVYHGIRK